MDYALRLHYSTLHSPSTINRVARAAKPHSSFKLSSFSLFPNVHSPYALSRQAFNPVICALNRPSTPSADVKDNGKKVIRVVAGATVVFACVLGIINCNNSFISRSAIAGTDHPIMYPMKAKDILDSFFVLNKQVSSTTKLQKLGRTLNFMKKMSRDEKAENLSKELVLIKPMKLKEAEKQLRNFIEEAADKYGPLEYNVEMILVVVLLFQGKYDDALRCKCLNDYAYSSDGRVILYKAIAHTMLGNDKNAKTFWKTFTDSISEDESKPSRDR